MHESQGTYRRAGAQTAVSLHLVIEVRLSDNPDHHLSTVDNDDDDKNNDDDLPTTFSRITDPVRIQMASKHGN